jgi:Flp pilus assembly protein TadG
MLRRFIYDKRATSAVEFALVLPFLVTLLLGSFELQRLLRHERRLTLAANTVAQMLAQRQLGDESPLESDRNSIIQVVPELTAAFGSRIWDNLAHQITLVAFRPTVAGCTQSCTYSAHVAQVWPTSAPGLTVSFADMRRQCGELTRSAAGSAPSRTTLPVPFGPGALIVVDLRLAFTPMIGSAWLPPALLTRQGFASPRFARSDFRFPKGQSNVLTCSGF